MMSIFYSLIFVQIFLTANPWDTGLPVSRNITPPNILLIFVDDLGYGDLGIHHNPDVRTPHIDHLASTSVRFETFYAQPVCAPSRAQILTGRPFLKTGIWHVYEERAHLNTGETLIPEVLKEAGYYTAFIGKWTLGRHGPYLPENRGFDDSWRQALEVPGNIYQHENPVVNINGALKQMEGWASKLYTDFALEAIDRAGDKPFFIELAHISTHEPYYAPDSIVQHYVDEGHSLSLSTFYAMVEQLDHETGRLLEELDDRNLSSNTLVIFTSDNGPIGNCRNLPDLTEAEMGRRNPLNLRGRKGSIFENGIRVPGFFRWTDKFSPGIISEPGDLADIYPTLIELAGLSVPANNLPVYGKSLVDLLQGKGDTLPGRYLYYANHQVNWKGREDESGYVHDRNDLLFEGTNLAIRQGKYKYVQFARNDEYGSKNQFTALYDLYEDPQEVNDVSLDFPALKKDLQHELRRWWNEEVINGSRSYHLPTYFLGFRNEQEVEIHVGSAVRLSGKIDYRAVNWILSLTNWSGKEAWADYQIEVLSEGKYEVLMSITAGPEPCRVEVVLGGQKGSELSLKPGEKIQEGSFGIFNLKPGKMKLAIRMTIPGDESGIGIQSLDKILVRRN